MNLKKNTNILSKKILSILTKQAFHLKNAKNNTYAKLRQICLCNQHQRQRGWSERNCCDKDFLDNLIDHTIEGIFWANEKAAG